MDIHELLLIFPLVNFAVLVVLFALMMKLIRESTRQAIIATKQNLDINELTKETVLYNKMKLDKFEAVHQQEAAILEKLEQHDRRMAAITFAEKMDELRKKRKAA